jgi:hypothetical protein
MAQAPLLFAKLSWVMQTGVGMPPTGSSAKALMSSRSVWLGASPIMPKIHGAAFQNLGIKSRTAPGEGKSGDRKRFSASRL